MSARMGLEMVRDQHRTALLRFLTPRFKTGQIMGELAGLVHFREPLDRNYGPPLINESDSKWLGGSFGGHRGNNLTQ